MELLIHTSQMNVKHAEWKKPYKRDFILHDSRTRKTNSQRKKSLTVFASEQGVQVRNGGRKLMAINYEKARDNFLGNILS